MRHIVVLSGPVAAGKTSLARALAERFGGERYGTGELIARASGGEARSALQAAGGDLDTQTGGRWLADALQSARPDELAVIDSARTAEQLLALREQFGRRVVHVHLRADEDVLRQRFADREPSGAVREDKSYYDVRRDPTEARVASLDRIAEVVLDAGRLTTGDMVAHLSALLQPKVVHDERLVDVLVGGQYGSEGKGNIASYLAPEYGLLVRVGGPNAGHTVYLPSGEPYAHRQLPSGTRFTEVPIVVGPGAVISPAGVLKEIRDCEAEARVAIDPQAMAIEADDPDREEAIARSIGSTRQGVGSATSRRVMRGDQVRLAREVPELRPFIRETLPILDDAYRADTRILLEGTQGTMLSLYHGSYPHVTSRDTTAAGCLAEAGIPPSRVRKVVMVCRTYPIRVESPQAGDSGPMREIGWDEVERRAGFDPGALAAVEKTTTTDRQRRVGEFEWDRVRDAALLNGPTDIAVSFADYVTKTNEGARRFEQLSGETVRFVEDVERVTGAPVSLISVRFSHPQLSIIDRRVW